MVTKFDRIGLLLMVGPPLLAGLVLGANQTRAGAYLPWPLSISYWVTISLLTWSLFALGTVVARWFLRPWAAPLWASWLVGAITGSLAARPMIYAIATNLRPLMEGPVLREMPAATPTIGFLSYYLTNWSVVIIMWLTACWLVDKWRQGKVRSPSDPAADVNTVGPAAQVWETQGFLTRIPHSLGRDILALHAEDHYVRVYTAMGDALILAAISDAIRSVEATGIVGHRVHRSWWVAASAVSRSISTGRKLTICLSNGIEVPVSQTYREVAKISGLLSSAAGGQ